jgi:transcription initiation factor TFIID subunit 2
VSHLYCGRIASADSIALPNSRYYEEIKRPMDLQTLSHRLEAGAYRSYRDFFAAFSLIASNCKLFNPPGTEPVLHADILERAWKSEWEKAIKMSPSERRSLIALVNKLLKEGA